MGRNDQKGWNGWVAIIALLAVGWTFSVPAPASAESDEEAEVDDETAKQVLKLLKSGKKAYKKENYQEAYDKFREAYELWPRPPIQARLGKAAEELGDKKKAAEHYRTYLEEKPDGDMTDKVRAKLDEVTKGLPATLKIESTPSGANVYQVVQNQSMEQDPEVESTPSGAESVSSREELGETPMETEVEPGERTFVLTADDYEATKRTWKLKAGEKRSVSVKLQQGAKPEPLGEPGQMTDDGEPSQGGGGNTLATLGWVGTSVGLAGLGVGGTFSILQDREVEEANSATTRPEFEDAKSAANAHHTRSLVAYSVGGAVTAVGAGLLVSHYLSKGSSEKRTSEAARLQLDVGFTRRGGWAGVIGEF